MAARGCPGLAHEPRISTATAERSVQQRRATQMQRGAGWSLQSMRSGRGSRPPVRPSVLASRRPPPRFFLRSLNAFPRFCRAPRPRQPLVLFAARCSSSSGPSSGLQLGPGRNWGPALSRRPVLARPGSVSAGRETGQQPSAMPRCAVLPPSDDADQKRRDPRCLWRAGCVACYGVPRAPAKISSTADQQ